MRNFYAFTFSVLCALSLTGCLRNSTSTVALPEIIIVEDVPDDVIPAAIRDEFESHMTVYEGKLPPIIEGQYVMDEMELSYNSVGDFAPGKIFADCYMAFIDQIGGSCRYAEKQANSTAHADKVYVTGNGNNFTAYFVARNQRDDGYTWSVMSTLVSGTITDSGIRNCQYAFIMAEKNDPDGLLMPVNGYRVFFDNNYLASRKSWLDEADNAPSRQPVSTGECELNTMDARMFNPQKH